MSVRGVAPQVKTFRLVDDGYPPEETPSKQRQAEQKPRPLDWKICFKEQEIDTGGGKERWPTRVRNRRFFIILKAFFFVYSPQSGEVELVCPVEMYFKQLPITFTFMIKLLVFTTSFYFRPSVMLLSQSKNISL